MPDFINPIYLWALPIGAIPIIIYYLMRFRSLRVQWGANYVLQRALDKLRKQLYWDQLLLIALRVIACLILVLLFARPTSGISRSGPADGKHRILVVDGSYSMLAGDADRTRWERALEAAKNLVGGWGRGQTWSVLVVGENAEWVVDGETLNTPEAAVERLKTLKPRETAASMLRGFQQLAGKFPDGNIEVYVLADDQATSWEGIEGLVLPQETTVYWICPELENRANLAVTRVRVANEYILQGHPNHVSVTLRNFSPQAVKGADVELLVDNTFYARETVSLLAGQETTLELDVSIDKPGSHHIAARIPQDVLKFDNSAYAGVEVVETVKVLYLEDPEVNEKFASSWEYLRTVGRLPEILDAAEEQIFVWGAPQFERYAKPDVPDLAGYSLVLIDGARKVTRALAEALQTHVRAGGSLLLMADPNIVAADWNEHLGRAGLLPAALGRLHSEKLDGPVYQSLSRDFEAGGLAGFTGAADGDLSRSKFYRWYDFGEPGVGVEVLARFTNRQPFLLEKRYEPGSVVLMSGAFNGSYNNLIVREFFLPFAFRTIAHAAGGNICRRTVLKNSSVCLRLPNHEGTRAVKFDMPNGESTTIQPAPVVTVPGGSPATGLASMLVVRGSETSWVWYGIQGPRVDSDLTAMGKADDERLTEEYGFVRVTGWDELQEQLNQTQAGNEWHPWLILVMVLGLLGEMLLQRRFV